MNIATTIELDEKEARAFAKRVGQSIATTIELDEKEARAFAKRVGQSTTPEAFAAILVKEQARRWADADFDSGAADLVAAVRAAPLAVQDAIVVQVTQSVTANP